MIIGCTKELKDNEYRVGLTPDAVKEYVKAGHSVLIEKDAGKEAGFLDNEYINAGANIVDNAKEVFAKAEMIVKVKEPEEQEWDFLREGQILYTYLHLASNKPLIDKLLEKKVTGVAYETIEDENGRLPCLIPMSKIAGNLAIQEGMKYLEKTYGGSGLLLGFDKGNPGTVLVLGGGTVGRSATNRALSLGAKVILIEKNVSRLDDLRNLPNLTILESNEENIVNSLKEADIVVGTVLIPGGETPKLVRKEHLKLMKKGSVLIDVAIDQGGCFETSHVTYHTNPIYVVDGIIHYCVGNMPGAVARTATISLNQATLKYGLMCANKQFFDIKNGLNVYDGKVINERILK